MAGGIMVSVTARGQNGRGRSRKRGGQYAQDIEAREREITALQLRTAGSSLADIAQVLGYSNTGTVSNVISRALKRDRVVAAEEYRTMAGQRLEAVMARLWEAMHRTHYLASGGKLMLDPDSGEPLISDDENTRAADAYRRAVESYCKLYGLQAPPVSVRVGVTAEADLDSRITEMLAEYAERYSQQRARALVQGELLPPG
jgi:AraC-like DNA-binding protein